MHRKLLRSKDLCRYYEPRICVGWTHLGRLSETVTDSGDQHRKHEEPLQTRVGAFDLSGVRCALKTRPP